MTSFGNRAAMVLIISSIVLISFHFLLGVAAGTQEAQARMAQEEATKLSGRIGSIALHVLGPLLAGGASILIVKRVDTNQVNRSRNWLVGLVVALGTFGLLYLV